MRAVIDTIDALPEPEAVVQALPSASQRSVILLRTALFNTPEARYSFLVANPFLTFRSQGAECRLTGLGERDAQLFGNPWDQLQQLLSRYELLDDVDLPFPLGGCFGFFGYDLKNFVEPKLPRSTVDDLDLPDIYAGFYSSVVVFDHLLSRTTIISTGLNRDGTRSERRAAEELEFWRTAIDNAVDHAPAIDSFNCEGDTVSNMSREQYEAAVAKAIRYIRQGDIYQVNLAHRLTARFEGSPWAFYQQLRESSPAPFAAYLDGGDFQLASSSPERFLRLCGAHIQTRPIKGTRPRDADPTRDAQLTYELQTSAKEMSELVMITDLLRNDLGRVCEFGSVHVPELVRLERYPQVQHLVSTVEGRLRPDITHLRALAKCFPGGSITGAPKIRAMQIIDEIETVTRGPYTGALGYLGFNRESQFSILIRTAVIKNGRAHFHAGAGIVADSKPAAEYDETLAKAAGFLRAIGSETKKRQAFALAPSESRSQ
ncbi:MAG TPA: aminodeoxychorismate synthase component I [Verrucomicrobiae bacterium]|nr:aminodeoxychorismate synthase component I [Verrucomicrobiae bacterium]